MTTDSSASATTSATGAATATGAGAATGAGVLACAAAVCWTTGAGGGTATGAATGAAAALEALALLFLAAEAEAVWAGILLLVSEETEGILERGMTTFPEKKGVKFYLNQRKKSHF